MAGLCESGNEPEFLKSHFFDVNGDSEMLFGERRPSIRHRLPDIRLTVGENFGKTQPGNQPKRKSNPRPSATPDRQASALAD
ncbi:hypothetical protein ANN_17612 [Periplaneta americana]|uniref:Uncharacterized protein n=1 Tax=Periplaneta americana TaxID=6978 RepID=A0ABQ8STZ9_PERAM|nr:hypothetical protein ANN_17612 [Periplaneta americana]